MKRIIIAMLIPAVLLIVSGCSKDFLTVNDQEYLTQGKVNELVKKPSNAAIVVEAKMGGIYEKLYISTGLNVRDDISHGIRGIQMTTDMMCADITGTDCWGYYEYNHLAMTEDKRRPNCYWSLLYSVIGIVNPIINNDLPQNEEEVVGDIQANYGQLHVIRAICYYYLVNLFQQPYLRGSQNELAVPLVLTDNEEELTTQATVQQLYDQIVSDLKKGAKFAGVPKDKSRIGADVANTYLARVYLEMGKFQEAEEAAKAAMGGKTPLINPVPDFLNFGFEDLTQPDNMWGYFVTGENTIFFGSPASLLDAAGNGYPSLGDDCTWAGYNWLVEQISDKDVRRAWFSPKKGSPQFNEYAKQFQWAAGKKDKEYYCMKFYGAKDFTGDVIYLRYSDVALMYIEALQAQGKEAEAKEALIAFMQVRKEGYDCSNLTGDELLNEIRLQRRIELWGEGVSLFDIRRWQIPMDRTLAAPSGAASNHLNKLKVDPGSPFFALQIPKREIENAKGKIIQNPAYLP